MKVKRVENTAWGTVDFIDPDANNDDSAVVFQTIPEVSRARKSQEASKKTETFSPNRISGKKSRGFAVGNWRCYASTAKCDGRSQGRGCNRYKHGMPAEIFDCEWGRFGIAEKTGDGARHSDYSTKKSTGRDARDVQNQAFGNDGKNRRVSARH